MPKQVAMKAAIVVADRPGVEDRLRDILAQFHSATVEVIIAQEPAEATAQLVMADGEDIGCVLVEAGDISNREAEDRLIERVRAIAAVPDVGPVPVAKDPPAHVVIRAIRAGAGDFIDLASSSTSGPSGQQDIVAILGRVSSRYREKVALRQHVRGLRTALEDFLKNLVKTERRSIDLERQLVAATKQRLTEVSEIDPDRPASVLIVEDDREVADLLVDELEQAGLITFAFVSGEEAVSNVARMAGRGEAIDLALVDARLPGMDGLEAICRMRESKPNLAAILMTGFSTTETAIGAADLGVVGYVLKPFDDIPGLIDRVKGRAIQSMNATRERHYLDEIKQRHEKILLRYRKLAADLCLD